MRNTLCLSFSVRISCAELVSIPIFDLHFAVRRAFSRGARRGTGDEIVFTLEFATAPRTVFDELLRNEYEVYNAVRANPRSVAIVCLF